MAVRVQVVDERFSRVAEKTSRLIKSANLSFRSFKETYIKTGNAVYFAKGTGHSKMRYSQIVSLSEHNKHAKLHSQLRKNLRKSIFKCPVRFVK